MAAINFPDSPTLNQEYTDDNGFTWKWNGTVWRGSTGTRQAAIIEVADTAGNFTGDDVEEVLAELADADDTKVAKSGDTMTGNLTVSKSAPRIIVNATNGGTNAKLADIYSPGNGYIYLRSRTDGDDNQDDLIRAKLDGTELYLQGNASVLVPDASADGEALAYRQAGAEVNTDFAVRTSAGDAWFYMQPGDADVYKIKAIADGRIQFLQDNATFMFVSGNQDVDFGDATTVEVPAISGASQAAQVTAYNATTGQLQIGGVEMGDTGWRDVSSLVTWVAGASPSLFAVRRIGNVVHMKLRGQIVTSAPTGPTTAQISTTSFNGAVGGSGFRPTTTSSIMSFSGSTGNMNHPVILNWNVTAAAGAYAVWPMSGATGTNSGYFEACNWITSDAWPSSLPGSAA